MLTPKRRRLAWIAFVLLLMYAPLVAYLVNGPLELYTLPRDSWLLPATVAGLVGFVLIIDDVERRKVGAAEPETPES